jgi:Flp pilus assembly protein TadG
VLSKQRDDGSISVLIIAYVGIAVVLVVIGIDASKIFLAQRALVAAADDAAIAAAQGVATKRIYDGALHCGQPVPISQPDAVAMANRSVNDARPDLQHTFTSVGSPTVTTDNDTATVALTGIVTVPFGRLVGWLDPGHADGEFRVAETSHATSPVLGGVC